MIEASLPMGTVIAIPLLVLLKNFGVTIPPVAVTLLIVIVGAVRSNVTVLALVTALTGDPSLPAGSL